MTGLLISMFILLSSFILLKGSNGVAVVTEHNVQELNSTTGSVILHHDRQLLLHYLTCVWTEDQLLDHISKANTNLYTRIDICASSIQLT
jgi:hypothetical protein